MKNLIYSAILIGISFFVTSCETTEITEVTEVIEAEPNILFERTLNFNTSNNFSDFVNFPNDFEIRDTDLVVAYRLEGLNEDSNGVLTPIWEPLPQTIFLDAGGTVLFTFNYSERGIEVFLDAENDVDKTALLEDLTTEQIFQFAILPSQLNTSSKILNSDLSHAKVSQNANFIK